MSRRDAREVLDEWLRERGDKLGPLFPTRTGERLTRVLVFKILQRIAAQANTHLAREQRITVVGQATALGTAVISRAEVAAALGKAARVKLVTRHAAGAALAAFNNDWEDMIRL